METPKSARKARAVRNPTPRLSERKKSLFVDIRPKEPGNVDLEGIKLFEPSYRCTNKSIDTIVRNNIQGLLDTERRKCAISFLNDVPKTSGKPLRRSPRKKENIKSVHSLYLNETNATEFLPKIGYDEDCADKQLHNIFNTSMRISSHDKNSNVSNQKRTHDNAEEMFCPLKKIQKCSPSNDDLYTISTKKFYSVLQPTQSEIRKKSIVATNILSSFSGNDNISPRSRIQCKRRAFGKLHVNKGVKHKIRRPGRVSAFGRGFRNSLTSGDVDILLKNIRNEKLKNLIAAKREQKENIEKLHNLFRKCPNPIEKARPLSGILGMLDDSNNNTGEKKCAANRNSLSTADVDDEDFSDIDSYSEEHEEISNAEEIIPLISHHPAAIEAALSESDTSTKKKFFKTGKNNTPKEIHITNGIKASICNGKLSLLQEEKKQKKRPKRRSSTTYDVTEEQATVDAILKNLDESINGEMLADRMPHKRETMESTNIQLATDLDYSHFRKRIPYNTTEPSVIEQQNLLLDFLINNNMCTEENFTIFVADPDNHKEEAARIVDQVFVLVNGQDYYRQRIPYNTDDPEVELQQHQLLDFLIANNMCTEENFDKFIVNRSQRHKEADDIMANLRSHSKNASPPLRLHSIIDEKKNSENNNVINTSKCILNNELIEKSAETPWCSSEKIPMPSPLPDTSGKLFPVFYTNRFKPLQQQSTRFLHQPLNMGLGANQYQIDAGQRNFGAHQCKQCGLVYSIHEPEEEKLHHDYHASVNLLRFKGWIDEDIVAIYPEWGADGRILRITETSHSRRLERLATVLQIVDKELGFASYTIPKTFVAYLAVRKFQLVGICLVVPLEKANKYVRVDGVDCCTEEEYSARCGISRIWVAPLHRRLRIASKLIYTTQQNTIFGEEIPVEQIAFSAPTENGRIFAQKVTQLEDFLVYQ